MPYGPSTDGSDFNIDNLVTMIKAVSQDRHHLLTQYLRFHIAQLRKTSVDQIPIDRNFQELGIDSLKMMNVVVAIEQDFQFSLHPLDIFDNPTIEALAQYLADEIQSDETASEPVAAQVPAPSIAAWGTKVQTPTQKIPGIVFLLSSPRSGSTLLRVMLAGHSKLFSPPELHLLPFATMRQRHEKMHGTGLDEGLARAFMELHGWDTDTALAHVENLIANDASPQSVYAELQKAAGQRLIVDKSPSYGASLDTLRNAETLFEGSRYIHLIRHPYATIDSIVKRRLDKLVGVHDVNPYVFAEQLWASSNDNIQRFLADIEPERKKVIRFEDLVAAPNTTMESLCSFLGISFEKDLLRPYEGERMTNGLHGQSLSIGDTHFLQHKDIDPALGEVWKKKELWRHLGPAARKTAAQLGYELPGQDNQPDTLGAMTEGRL